jgi:cytochrome c oxidase cbb3-type subunit 2
MILVGAALGWVVFAAGDPAFLEEGRSVYARQCAPCHGDSGRGDGPAAYLLYPRPRDFTSGRYKLVSTWEGVPTDEDLLASITRGMPGSAMPAWGHLPERTRRALVAYVKSLSAQPLEVQPASDPTPDGGSGRGVVKVPPEPPDGPASLARARELFADACASCHGASGRGDGVQEQYDDFGYPTRPRDLTLGVFKGNPSSESVYRRIISGMPGTPMPSSSWAYGDDAWHLSRLVRSWSSDRQRQRVEMRRETIRATRLDKLPIHPDDGAWHHVPVVNLHLMPLWWRTDRPEEVAVRAAHDGNELALLMVWHDATDDHTALRPQDFRDAVAVQFSLDGEPPFLAMGDAAAAVNIWMWKSERQADIGSAFQEIDRIYPNIGIDSYPNLLKSPLEQPTRQAVTLESDPTFITGWGAGNIVSDPTRLSAVEDLRAGGFGTLRARPRIDQQVKGNGVYGNDSYRVMLRRPLKGQGADSVQLAPGSKVEVAFAVWNGSAGDRDGKKSVTIWQELLID